MATVKGSYNCIDCMHMTEIIESYGSFHYEDDEPVGIYINLENLPNVCRDLYERIVIGDEGAI